MSFDDKIKDLLREGALKAASRDSKVVARLIERAEKDIETAERNLGEDNECSYTYSYNSMLRLGLAMIFSRGYRPDVRNKHLTVVRFVRAVLGEVHRDLVNDFDFMRRKRHRLLYEAVIPCSRKEAESAINTARKFLLVVREFLEGEGE